MALGKPARYVRWERRLARLRFRTLLAKLFATTASPELGIPSNQRRFSEDGHVLAKKSVVRLLDRFQRVRWRSADWFARVRS
jgi:hypothetical protein